MLLLIVYREYFSITFHCSFIYSFIRFQLVFRFILFILFVILFSLEMFGRNRNITLRNIEKLFLIYIYVYIYMYIYKDGRSSYQPEDYKAINMEEL